MSNAIDLNQYNLVSPNSNLSHENMLFSADRFGNGQVEIGLYSNDRGQERIAKQSIGSCIEQFNHDQKKDRLSILLCKGNVSTKENQSGNSYQELTGDSHWTTLHLRKDQAGNLHAFYSDSLSHDNNDIKTIPTSVTSALNASGIEPENIKKIQCQRQPDFHKCGDHALFNALAMNQLHDFTSVDQLNETIAVQDKYSTQSTTPRVDQFYEIHRNALAEEFNNRIVTYQPTQQNQRSNTYAGTDDQEARLIQMAIDKSLEEKSLSDIVRDQYSQRSQGPEGEGKRKSPQSSEDFLPQQISPIAELKENLNRYDQIKNIYDIKDEESMIQRAMELSLIEQQNLELLKKFQTQIQPSVDDIKGQKDEYSQNLVDNISSPLVASNIEKFLPLLEAIQRDPNKINNHDLQYQFENNMFETQGTTRAQHSQKTDATNKMHSSFDRLDSLKQYFDLLEKDSPETPYKMAKRSLETNDPNPNKAFEDFLGITAFKDKNNKFLEAAAPYLNRFIDGVKDYLGIQPDVKEPTNPYLRTQLVTRPSKKTTEALKRISDHENLKSPENFNKVMPFLKELTRDPNLLTNSEFQDKVIGSVGNQTSQEQKSDLQRDLKQAAKLLQGSSGNAETRGSPSNSWQTRSQTRSLSGNSSRGGSDSGR